MAKVKAPILSGAARGQISKTQVYATWRGVPYARTYVVPSNPKTVAQTERRNIFAMISDYWKRSATITREPWTAAIVGRPLTERNLIISQNLQPLVGEVDKQKWVGSPGARGGVPPTAIAAAPGTNPGDLDVTITSPAAPTGWTLVACQAAGFIDGVPTTLIAAPLAEAENTSPTEDGDTVVILTGLAASLSVAVGWTKWTKPDGSFAYGASIGTTGTPT